MLHRTTRPHRPAVKVAQLTQASTSFRDVPPTLRRPRPDLTPLPPVGPPADASPVDPFDALARGSFGSTPGAALSGPPAADLTDAERVVLEDLFHRASQVRQVCLTLLAVGLLVLLVVLMR